MLGVVADDTTGANDIGLIFSKSFGRPEFLETAVHHLKQLFRDVK
jgi:uncharacterized protein YgbK (DUF1537 family)